MVLPRRQVHNKHRITAWLLMLVCAWMGTGGVLNHTETAARRQHKTASSFFRQSVAVPVDTCAACEWTQGLQGRTLAISRVVFPLFRPHSRQQSPSPAFIARTLSHRPSRAPPISSAFC